jgi:hypothetical protein
VTTGALEECRVSGVPVVEGCALAEPSGRPEAVPAVPPEVAPRVLVAVSVGVADVLGLGVGVLGAAVRAVQ